MSLQAEPSTKKLSAKPRPAKSAPVDGAERLQKVLAGAGLGSRRQCEELILTGRVAVDGKTVTALGTKADPQQQEIRVDGQPLARPRLVYFMVNKPTGVVTTNSDPSGRPRVIDLVPYPGRLFAVGRLDLSSEGLILVTNDGELANRLTHPRYGVEKTYQVEVAGSLDRKELERLRKGVHLAEGFARVVSVKVKRQYKNSTQLEIVLNEGRNREIRRLLARVGHKAVRVKRVALGPLRMAELPVGRVRELDRDELRKLRHAAAGLAEKPARRVGQTAAPKPKPAVQVVRSVIGGDSAGVKKAAMPRTPPKPGPFKARPAKGRPAAGRPTTGRPGAGRPGTGKSGPGKSSAGRTGKPFRAASPGKRSR